MHVVADRDQEDNAIACCTSGGVFLRTLQIVRNVFENSKNCLPPTPKTRYQSRCRAGETSRFCMRCSSNSSRLCIGSGSAGRTFQIVRPTVRYPGAVSCLQRATRLEQCMVTGGQMNRKGRFGKIEKGDCQRPVFETAKPGARSADLDHWSIAAVVFEGVQNGFGVPFGCSVCACRNNSV